MKPWAEGPSASEIEVGWEPPRSPRNEGYRSPATLATTLRWLLAGWALVAIVAAAAQTLELVLVGDFQRAPDSATFAQIVNVDGWRVSFEGLASLAFLITGVVFIVWTRRVYRNLRPLDCIDLRHREGWAVGAWFVPFASLFLPKQILNDVWRGSDPDAESPMRLAGRRVSPILDWWWTVFLTACILRFAANGRVSDAGFETADQLEALRSGLTVSIVHAVVLLVAAVLAWRVVTEITRRQELRATRLYSSGEGRAG
jgi:Domain of unknown function (DUF4328)